jgi:hypothetical protein
MPSHVMACEGFLHVCPVTDYMFTTIRERDSICSASAYDAYLGK